MINRCLKFLISPSLFLIIVFYLSVAIFFAYLGFEHQSIPIVIFMLSMGILIWTLVEYGMHRLIFHGKNSNVQFKQFQFFMHGYHHIRPTDPSRLVLPLIVTLPSTILIYALFKFIFGVYAESIFSGFILGYLLYDFTHYSIHRFNPKTALGKFSKRYHFHHHFKADHSCFGVTSPIWDFVFKTTKGQTIIS